MDSSDDEATGPAPTVTILSPAEDSFMGIQIRAAKKKARERRPRNIAQRWSRNVQGYQPGTEKEGYMVMPLYVIGRTGNGIGGGGGGDGGDWGVAGVQPPPCAYMEVVDAGGDTVMCCCDCGGSDDPDRCRLRGYLGEKGEVWARGEAVEVEFTHGNVAFLKEVMKNSHVSTKIEIYYE